MTKSTALNRMTAFAAMALAALTLAVPAGAKAVTEVTNPEIGVHVMGSDKAEVKLTEWVSYTCPHCAHFEGESGDRLRLYYVGSGKMKLEVRHLVRDPYDLVAALLTNCGPVGRFDRNHAMFLKTQETWLTKLQNSTQAQRNRYSTGSYPQRWRSIAKDAGFYEMMRTRGYDSGQVDRCLSDEALARKLSEKTRSYREDTGITGTPSFAINDVVLAGTHDWESLKFQLDLRF